MLGLRGGWTERLKSEEAWELAEAIDLVREGDRTLDPLYPMLWT
ncbi:hypothetical protein [Candidatus Amarobacter glycogenicus]